jgi:hypothetical protein
MAILSLMVTFLCVLRIFYYKWKKPLENSIRRLLEIEWRTCGGRLRTCVLCQKMEISDKLQKYQDRLASYISCQMPEISENMHMLQPYKIPCNLSDADNVFQLTVCTYRGAVTVCAICRLPAINCRWSYMSVGAVLEKIKSVNCWQTCVNTSMYIEDYDGLCHLWDAGNIWQLKMCKFRDFWR